MAYGDYTPTTELEAVNMMLECLGEQPINSIPTTGISEATIARDILYRVSREVQKEGLECNSEENYELTPDEDGYLNIPGNALFVDASDTWNNYVQRGSKLYDKDEHTDVFTDSVEVDIVFFLEFTDLPEHARHYISIVAARQFQSRMLSSAEVHKFTEADQLKAQADFKRAEGRTKDYSMLDNSSIAHALIRRR